MVHLELQVCVEPLDTDRRMIIRCGTELPGHNHKTGVGFTFNGEETVNGADLGRLPGRAGEIRLGLDVGFLGHDARYHGVEVDRIAKRSADKQSPVGNGAGDLNIRADAWRDRPSSGDMRIPFALNGIVGPLWGDMFDVVER